VAGEAETQSSAGGDEGTTLDPASGANWTDGSSADAFDAVLTLDAGDLAFTSPAWSPAGAPADGADADLDLTVGAIDLLAVPALEVPLGA